VAVADGDHSGQAAATKMTTSTTTTDRSPLAAGLDHGKACSMRLRPLGHLGLGIGLQLARVGV